MLTEIEKWLKQAEADMQTAKNSFKSKDFYASAFWCQQSVEKILKAFLLQNNLEVLKTHSVVLLAKKLNLPKSMTEKISLLEPIYQATRYPNIPEKLLYEEFDEFKVKKLIIIAEEVLAWIKEMMK